MFGSRKNVKRNQILNQLAADLPETRWLLLVDENGIEKGSFPDSIGDKDRIAAMSAAILALGQRVTKELKGGELRYALFGGTLNVHLIVMVSSGHVLALGLRPGVSLDAFLKALRASISPLLDELKIELPANWLD